MLNLFDSQIVLTTQPSHTSIQASDLPLTGMYDESKLISVTSLYADGRFLTHSWLMFLTRGGTRLAMWASCLKCTSALLLLS